MRRKLFGFAALSATFLLGLCAQIVWLSLPAWGRHEAETLRGTVSRDYNLTGYYYGAHEFPWAFDNVERIDLTTADYRVNAGAVSRTPIAPKGYLITDFDIYRMSSVSVADGRLSFTTVASLGVSYEFTGRILDEGDYPLRGYPQYFIAKTIMVEGRMVRRLFGFKVAESEVRFTKGSGC